VRLKSAGANQYGTVDEALASSVSYSVYTSAKILFYRPLIVRAVAMLREEGGDSG
jgi:hypothetical protein